MFDLESLTLWTTMDGKPVLGELADSDMALKAYPVVTTTWKEWRELHPNTTVLSQQTGHTRDYSEGAFYRQWASDDRPLFAVTSTDDRLQPTADGPECRVEVHSRAPFRFLSRRWLRPVR